MTKVSLVVNGEQVNAQVEGRTLLVALIRDQLGLTGTHVGCETSQCGACTVEFNGDMVKSCAVLAVQAEGATIVTIEGLAKGESLHPVQRAFSACHGLQCGFCTPGMVMAAWGILKANPAPTEAEIVRGLEGNLCRCTGYVNIVKSVQHAAELMMPAVGKAYT